MTDIAPTTPQLIRNYKRARKFPHLIGRTHTGGRIPGGPYTPAQALGTAAVAAALIVTWHWWTRFGSTGQNVMIMLGLPGATLWSLGKLPQAGRNPISVVIGVGKAVTAGLSAPTTNGLPTHAPRRPVALTGAVVIDDSTPTPSPALTASKPLSEPENPNPAATLGTAHLLALAHARRAA